MDSGKKDIQFKHLIKINVDDAVTGFTNKNVLSHHLNPSVEIACQILSRIFFLLNISRPLRCICLLHEALCISFFTAA